MFLFMDFETYSPVDISCGVRKYLSHDESDIICGVFKLVNREREVIEQVLITQETLISKKHSDIVSNILSVLFKQTEYIIAHNIEFDLEVYLRILQQRFSYPGIPNNSKLICTKKRQDFLGQPASLSSAADFHVLNFRKDTRGKYLIQQLSKPNKNGLRNYDPTLEQEMLDYCRQDVDTLIELFFSQVDFYKSFEIKNTDYLVQCLDTKINRTGFPVNLELAKKLTEVAEAQAAESQLKACEILNDFDMPALTQTQAIKNYIEEKFGYAISSFDDKKQTHENAPEIVKKLIDLRNVCSSNSLAKAQVVLDSAVNNRMYNQFKYCGTHTGRWSGRDFQPQNLPKSFDENHPDYDENDPTYYIRSIISCSSKTTLIVMDYASIEHRALFFFAKKFIEQFGLHCEDTLKHFDKFLTGEDTYVELASKIYNTPKENIKKNSQERQVGKVAHLGLGYGMGADKFRLTARQSGLDFTEDESKRIVNVYRSTYTIIPKLWQYFNDSFVSLVQAGEDKTIELFYGMKLRYKQKLKNGKNCLSVELPSGRQTFYYDLMLENSNFGNDKKTLEVSGKYTTVRVVFAEQETFDLMLEKSIFGNDKKTLKVSGKYIHGGLIVENVVQAFCRDLLATDMLSLDDTLKSAKIVAHVHDEIVVETYDEFLDYNLDLVERLASQTRSLCVDFPVSTEIYTSKYYRK